MAKGKLVLVLGGARSGKSQFAEKLAEKLGEHIVYLASASVADEEMARRVKIHQERRPSNWQTKEETLKIVNAVAELNGNCEVILFDCLTLWLSNLLLNGLLPKSGTSWPEKENYILKEVERLAEYCTTMDTHVIIVSNEVSLGIVPDNRLGRSFRDVAGRANQIIAQHADEVYLVAAGIPIEIKSKAYQI
ncbi:bifunctional adenosylcobinamide kinase/adenosylcobinamide-phosphate guanylyltransferase [Desulfotomaculum nigrificans]|uniref:bifunctional adenosylcobinamide kinase/adenosylcobinamide-phosphate guanylyltransferase n=1 Tax=Desulfotomaculum nigrificans TaxID=1565 RepID=UPI0001FADE04|nr:bifunctional adenosylcobinamide kinase/adenosylcobinamide-phosphate guanylyltransferase [Desulfotomaculum nigrificans]